MGKLCLHQRKTRKGSHFVPFFLSSQLLGHYLVAALVTFGEGMNVLYELLFLFCLKTGSHVAWIGFELTEAKQESKVSILQPPPLEWLGLWASALHHPVLGGTGNPIPASGMLGPSSSPSTKHITIFWLESSCLRPQR